jgi:hypothetical protein
LIFIHFISIRLFEISPCNKLEEEIKDKRESFCTKDKGTSSIMLKKNNRVQYYLYTVYLINYFVYFLMIKGPQLNKQKTKKE